MEGGLALLYPALAWSVCASGHHGYTAAPGTPEERRRKIALMAQGRYLGAAALFEPQTGSDLSSVACSSRRDGESWIVNGNKYWCTFADGSDFIRVLCRLHGPDVPTWDGEQFSGEAER
jgi:alkylation response protein AidB-like acyl-CoA dehydrogenase